MKLNPTIFREYDIRGIAEEDFDGAFARTLGRAFGSRVVRARTGGGRPTIAVGRDYRPTSPGYAAELIAGLRESGVDVLDIGPCPTPLLYFALHELPVDGGVEVTASHNPSEFNGFKLCLGKQALHGEAITSLCAEMQSGDFTSGAGTLGERDVATPYLAFCREQFGTVPRRLRVVCDAGNGAGGVLAPQILRALGCEVVELYCEPDGTFPNHHPDPTVPENLVDLIAEVAAHHADLGVAFDGDADRIGVIAPGGRILWGDELLVIFAREILSRRPGAVVISEVKCSQRLFDDIARHGGQAIMWKAGHSLIKAKMKETRAAVGGEMSGHMFFEDRFFGHDDAIYAAARLIDIIARSGGGVLDLLAGLPEAHTTPELRVDCPDALKFEVVERVRERLRRDHEIVDVDGVRVKFEHGWGLVRASNTQPALVLRFEATTPEARDNYRVWLEGVVTEERAKLS